MKIENKKILIDDEKTSLELFKKVLERAKQKHGLDSFNSSHQILGVVTEEYTEFLKAVHENDDVEQVCELCDIMATAFWGIASFPQSIKEEAFKKL